MSFLILVSNVLSLTTISIFHMKIVKLASYVNDLVITESNVNLIVGLKK